jgi:hypothetical protein
MTKFKMIIRKPRFDLKELLLAVSILFCLISCKTQTSREQSGTKNWDTEKIKETQVKENMFPVMRRKALTTTGTQLNLKLDSNKTIAYGVIMDWNIGQAIVTVVAFQTGDASMYVSTGQIYIGGYAHKNIRNAGLAFVSEAQSYLAKAIVTDNTSLPGKGCVKFYILTNKGKYTFQETIENLENKCSDWIRMFHLGNDIISQYRTTIGQ